MSSWIHAVQAAAGVVTAGGLALFLVRLTLIAGAGRLALALLPRASAASRHVVATVTLAALVALPLATALLPAWQLPILPHRDDVEAHSPALQVTTAETFVKRTYDAFDGDAPFGATASTERLATPRPQAQPLRSPVLPRLPNSWPLAFAILALAISEAMLLRLALSLAAAGVFARGAEPVTDARMLRVFDAACERLDLRRTVDLRTTPRVSVPVVSGVVAPTLLLPPEAHAWDAERLNVVFLHELAHVRRCDTAFLLLARAAGALYWFHPYVRALVRDARRECEQACDDRVLASGIRASAYAEHLLTIARSAAERDALGGAVLAIARRSNLERRLSSILCLGVERAPASRRAVWMASLLSLLVLLPLASVRVTAASAPRPAKRSSGTLVWEAVPPVAPVSPVTSVTTLPTTLATPTTPAPPATPPLDLVKGSDEGEAAGNLDFNEVAGDEYDHANKDSGRDWFSRAHRYYQRDRYGEAALAYERAARAGHNIETAFYNAACSYALDHQREQALAMLSAAVEAGWDDADKIESDSDFDSIRDDRRFRQIVSQVRSADPHESEKKSAAAEYEALRRSRSADAGAWGDAGVSLMRAGEHARAVQAFETQIRLGSSSNAIYNLACAHALGGETAEALATLERAILEGFGDADHMRDDDDLASLHHERRFDELVRLCEDLELNHGIFQDNDRHAWREKLPRYERVAAQYPRSGRAWFNLGYAQLRARDHEGSRASFGRALDLKYRPPTTMYNLACVAAQMRDFDTAIRWLERADAAGMKLENHAPGDRDLDPLRADARYRQLLHRLGDRQWDKVRNKLRKL